MRVGFIKLCMERVYVDIMLGASEDSSNHVFIGFLRRNRLNSFATNPIQNFFCDCSKILNQFSFLIKKNFSVGDH